jgi:hypothetical protein
MQKVSQSSAAADAVHIHLSANQLQRLPTETDRVRVSKIPPSKRALAQLILKLKLKMFQENLHQQKFTKWIFHNRQVSQSLHLP